MHRAARSAVAVFLSLAALSALTACSSGTTDTGGTSGDGWTKIDAATLQARLEDPSTVLVNVHVPYEGEIPGTDAFIPYTEIAQKISDLPSDPSKLVIYCRSGNMSTEAAKELVAAGYQGFAELSGGFYAWQAAGLPLKMTPQA
ncbi:MAG: rhodanese-like domain-containing protein [Planctomycetaceae bacterium]